MIPIDDPDPAAEQPGSVTVRSTVRIGQTITFALAQGVIIVTAVMLFLTLRDGAGPLGPAGQGNQPAAAASPLGDPLVLIGIALTVVACVFAAVIPGSIRRAAAKRFHDLGGTVPVSLQGDTPLTPPLRDLVQSKMNATIVSQAWLEGAAVVCAVLMLVSGQYILLAPIAVAVFGIVVQVPTTAKVLDWLQWQQ